MKKILTILAVFAFIGTYATVNSNLTPTSLIEVDFGKKKIEVGASEKDAELYVNGKLIGKGSAEVTVGKDDCIIVEAKKIGFLTETIEFCNKKDMSKPPKTHFFQMKR